MDMEQMTVLQLATVLTGSLLTTQKVDLEDHEEVDKVIKEAIRIVKETKKELGMR